MRDPRSSARPARARAVALPTLGARRAGWALAVTLAVAAALLVTSEARGERLPEREAPSFSLEDVNPTSPTGGTTVSPEDHEGHVSAFYFAHAT